MFNWLYRLILRWMAKQPPRQTDAEETKRAHELQQQYKQWAAADKSKRERDK